MADRDRDGWHADGDYLERGGRIVHMAPSEFLARVRPLDIDETSRDNIDDLKRHVEAGRRLDPLRIGADGREDGRHRAHACAELGIAEVPVIVFAPGE
jgi:ParB-like chromosome segregation protein Spo0J